MVSEPKIIGIQMKRKELTKLKKNFGCDVFYKLIQRFKGKTTSGECFMFAVLDHGGCPYSSVVLGQPAMFTMIC